ncbi:MAG: 1-deoxy-D-xylulose-5-phosphate synthase, partial [Lentisphaeria bacterium]|nr:1-deoxy-D-xylulose-5-phosphate synthase [Lentisphaeria bacterium]
AIPELIRMLETARDAGTPCIVHVITDKGKGYRPAEESPGLYHGVSPFDPANGVVSSSKMTYSKAFGMTMCELASRRNDIAAITAAMTSGTGLDEFAKRCPDRFFDVGIAEEHALVFASGLAAGGMVPVAAIYATFLQRALDPVYHDICLQNLPVVMALDRAGAVEDGPTHHGIYDLSFLRALPNLTIFEPMDEGELRDMLFCAVSLGSPAVIRYPRGSSGRETDLTQPVRPVTPGKAAIRRQGGDLAIWSSGAETLRALETAEILAAEYGLQATVVHAVTIKPLDRDLLRQQAQQMPVFTCEDHVKTGGLASAAAESLQGVAGLTGSFGWPDDGIVPHGKICDLRKNAGLMPRQIAAASAEILKKNS